MTSFQSTKKAGFLFTAAIAILLLQSACDTKSCRCYIYDGVNSPYKDIEYVAEGTSCSSLDYQNGKRYRYCTEMSDPDINPGEIGEEYK